MENFKHPELQTNEQFLINLTEDEFKNWKKPKSVKSMRMGKTAYNTRGEIVKEFKPVFIVLKGDTDFLTIGDTVNWRGGFGRDEAKPAKITGIEVCPLGSKYGTPVKQILWKKINDSTKTIVVNLDNGHWAYGVQISKLSTK